MSLRNSTATCLVDKVMTSCIYNGKIVLHDRVAEGLRLYMQDGKITALTEENLPADEMIDAKGQYVSPGFIDMHLHGGGGEDFMDGGIEPILKAAELHLAHGTTSLLPTSLASSMGALREFLSDLRTVKEQKLCRANLLGAHLEGPYFSQGQRGAQNPDYITPPKPEDYLSIIKDFGDVICRWSYAPELEGVDEFCDALVASNIVPSLAHTEATYPEVKRAFDRGCRLATHFYSGMNGVTRRGAYRHLGAVESAYLLDDMDVEVIADGHHLPADLLRLILKIKGIDHVALVTDSMRGGGQPDGESFLGRREEAMPCVIDGGVAFLLDRSCFAGSVATTDQLVRTMTKKVGVSVPDAIRMMCENPARILGVKTKGRLEVGYDADIVFFDDDINVSTVFVDGKRI